MTALAQLSTIQRRLSEGEPIRILIGERFYAASEIVPMPAYAWKLRRELLTGIEAQIEALNTQAINGEDHA